MQKNEKLENLYNINIIKEEDKSEIFFIEPNIFCLYLKYSYYVKKLNLENKAQINEINPEAMNETKDLFYSSVIFSEFFYEEEKTKFTSCLTLVNKTGYKKLYNMILERKDKIINFSNIKFYLSYVLDAIKSVKIINKKIERKKKIYESKVNQEKKIISQIQMHTFMNTYNSYIYDFNEKLGQINFQKEKNIKKLKWYEKVLICFFELSLVKKKDTYDDDIDPICSIF